MSNILPYICYTYLNGPWRLNCIKYNYDPRIDRNSIIYQVRLLTIIDNSYKNPSTQQRPYYRKCFNFTNKEVAKTRLSSNEMLYLGKHNCI